MLVPVFSSVVHVLSAGMSEAILLELRCFVALTWSIVVIGKYSNQLPIFVLTSEAEWSVFVLGGSSVMSGLLPDGIVRALSLKATVCLKATSMNLLDSAIVRLWNSLFHREHQTNEAADAVLPSPNSRASFGCMGRIKAAHTCKPSKSMPRKSSMAHDPLPSPSSQSLVRQWDQDQTKEHVYVPEYLPTRTR
jgi:hypothetical protein